MRSQLLNLLCCPSCGGQYYPETESLLCQRCKGKVPLRNGIPIFTSPPADLIPGEKRVRGEAFDTPWRKANTRFLRTIAATTPSEAIFLDVGAGPGEFSHLFRDRRYFALDIYPYPEVDLVCDLLQTVPFRPQSLDVIILTNVLEHIPDPRALLRRVSSLLKPQGRVVISVPFLLKIHQAPYDFARYTHFFWQRLGEESGLEVEHLEGYYNPSFLVKESLRYIRFWTLPQLPRPKRLLGRIWLALANLLTAPSVLFGEDFSPPWRTAHPAPVGYHLVYRKPH